MLDVDQLLRSNTKYYEKNYTKKYDKLFEEYARLSNVIINKRSKIQKDDYDITNSVDSVSARFKNSKVTFNKPKYESYELLKQQVDDYILSALYKYNRLKKTLLYDNSISDQNDVMKQIETLTTKLNNMYELRNVLRSSFLLRKTQTKQLIEELETNINTIRTNHLISFNDIEDAHNNLQDSIQQKSMIQDYLTNKSNKNITESILNKRVIESYYNYISDIVTKLPSIDGSSDIGNEPIKVSQKKDPKMSKIDHKAKKILQANQSQDFDSKTYKKKMTKFLFNTIDECTSSKRSKDSYMSREEIIDIINKDPDLQKKLGKIYKTLSKKELCSKLLETSKIPNQPEPEPESEPTQIPINNNIEDRQPEEQTTQTTFPFKTKSECESSKRSKLYYMSREDIMKKIDNDNELKTKVGNNYRKLSKDELCNKLMT